MARILVADDEQLIRQLVCDFLNEAGHTTVEAADGAQAIAQFQKNPDVALVLLDIMMPEKDGWEVTREIRAQSDVPIILLSARGQEFDQLTDLARRPALKPVRMNTSRSRSVPWCL